MNKQYDYYKSIIKPIEKKYNRLCTLYSIFKCNFLKNKVDYYNELLIVYYKYLSKNPDVIKEIELSIL